MHAAQKPIACCLFCRDESETLKKCSACKVASYCGTQCQKGAYRQGHKTYCPKVKALNEEVALLDIPVPEGGTFFTATLINDYFKNKKKGQLKDGGDPARLHSFHKLATLYEGVGLAEQNHLAISKAVDMYWVLYSKGYPMIGNEIHNKLPLLLLAIGRFQESYEVTKYRFDTWFQSYSEQIQFEDRQFQDKDVYQDFLPKDTSKLNIQVTVILGVYRTCSFKTAVPGE